MSRVYGPITVTVEILGTHSVDALGRLLASLSIVLEREMGAKNYSVNVDWGEN